MRSQVEMWVILIGLAVVTSITRGFFLLMGTRVSLPETVQRALRYAPAGALVAIVMPEILLMKSALGTHQWEIANPHTWGGLAAVITFVMARSMVLTILIGMVVFTLVRLLF